MNQEASIKVRVRVILRLTCSITTVIYYGYVLSHTMAYEGMGLYQYQRMYFNIFNQEGRGSEGRSSRRTGCSRPTSTPITNIGYMFPSFFKADRLQQADPRVRDAADQFAGGRLQEVVRGGRTRGSSLSAQNKLLARLRIRPFFDRMPKGEITWLGVHVSF